MQGSALPPLIPNYAFHIILRSSASPPLIPHSAFRIPHYIAKLRLATANSELRIPNYIAKLRFATANSEFRIPHSALYCEAPLCHHSFKLFSVSAAAILLRRYNCACKPSSVFQVIIYLDCALLHSSSCPSKYRSGKPLQSTLLRIGFTGL